MKKTWETRDEKIKHWMRIPAKKKLQWLQQMLELAKQLPPSSKRARVLLRKSK